MRGEPFAFLLNRCKYLCLFIDHINVFVTGTFPNRFRLIFFFSVFFSCFLAGVAKLTPQPLSELPNVLIHLP